MNDYNEIEQIKSKLDYGLSYGTELYNNKITEISESVFHNGQTFYHGTKKQRTIAKNGFWLNPKKGQAIISARELGEGVYLTPNKKVASYFAGIRGGILPVEVNLRKVAAVNKDSVGRIMMTSSMHIDNLIQKITPAMQELFIKELFTRNGYNAAYTKEAMGFTGSFLDKMIGAKQSQITVFNLSDVKILPKTFKERFANQMLQIKTIMNIPVNIVKEISNFFKELRKA